MCAEKLLERITLELVPLTPLRVGAGSDGNLQTILTSLIVRKYTLRPRANEQQRLIIKRVPVIPASTIKGLLRATTERIAKTLYRQYRDIDSLESIEDLPRFLAAQHHQPKPCIHRRSRDDKETLCEEDKRGKRRMQVNPPLHQHPDNTVEKAVTVHERKLDTLIDKRVAELLEKQDISKCAPKPPDSPLMDWFYEVIASRYCPICILYGSTHQAGAIRPTDAIPIEEPEIVTRTHVTIERKTRTKAEQKLYIEELVKPGTGSKVTRFKATINILWPLPSPEEEEELCATLRQAAINDAKKLWQLTLQYLQQSPTQLGAGKTRGNGAILLRVI